jgi:carboxyl-terminal processing protease
MLTDDIGYIYLYQFAGECAAEFQTAVKQLPDQGAKGLIIDLRDNPGGWVDAAQDIGDIFLDKGTLCYLQYNDGSREYYSTKAGKTDLPLVILMNENSASSSEILAGALKDRADATIVGVQSYGKGIVQTVLELDGGAGMQMTIAQYYTPNGNAVHKVGITPDVLIELPEGDIGMYEFGDLSDVQLAKALEIMQQKIAK